MALAQLTTLIDLTFLDGVLAPDKPSKRQQHHSLIISNTVAKNWHMPVTQSLMNLNEVGLEAEQESVIQTAVACIECLPKGKLVMKSCHISLSKDQISSSSSSAFPARFLGFTILGEIFGYVTVFYSNR